MELREVRVFLTLVEELHYGRTAERLRLTPARVSQTIQTLEAKLGGRLLERTSRKVSLTPLVSWFFERYPDPGVVGVPIRDLPAATTALMWLKHNRSAKLTAFADAAAEVVSASGASPGPRHGALRTTPVSP